MEKRNETVLKIAQTALFAALCFVSFTVLRINIPLPGGDAVSLHISNAFCVLGALVLGGWYGGLAGAIGLSIADILDPVYITGAPKTFLLKLCIGLVTGLVAHHIARINESSDKKYVFRWSVIASVAGLGFNVIADPVAGYFYNQFILGQPQQIADILAKWSAGVTLVNAVVSVLIAGILYNALRPVLMKSGMIRRKRKVQAEPQS
ncbi:ECF transporter S component [Ruminococcus sp. CLA-AA-H200]|uniref:ECF transporter S component n=1 Tax=Ruminococcus turbiniformis TaxID=2881258 RepID=A0ABS8G2N2_9FIRM|nr:ECF transporter S component [Ruminococcus turbiniformis]MCC2255838.1 ECF transporter S component [Ruminococcus turbiniformis]